MTEIVDPFRDQRDHRDPNDLVGKNEKSYTNIEHSLLETKTKTQSCDKYGKKLEGKLLEAEAFATVWQKSGKDLKDALEQLQPLMATNPVLKQKLSTVLEMAEGNLQVGFEAGIALKTVSRCRDQSESVIKQVQTVLDEMMDSLMIFVELGLIRSNQNEASAESSAEASAEANTRELAQINAPINALINTSIAETSSMHAGITVQSQDSHTKDGHIQDSHNMQTPNLLFSGQARVALAALNSLKAELHEMQNRIKASTKQS
jgi:hypothetical protein